MTDFEAVGTEACPFCGMPVDDPGEGFMRHLEAHPSCAAQHGDWSDNLAKDTLAD